MSDRPEESIHGIELVQVFDVLRELLMFFWCEADTYEFAPVSRCISSNSPSQCRTRVSHCVGEPSLLKTCVQGTGHGLCGAIVDESPGEWISDGPCRLVDPIHHMW